MTKPFEGALTFAEQKSMKDHYFLDYEVDRFNKSQTIDGQLQDLNFSAANFQRMLKDRLSWAMRLKSMKWSDEAIAARIMMYYENKRSIRGPHDLLQSEASPSARQRGETDNAIARRLLKLSRVRANFGMAYAQMESHTVPQKNLPHPPNQ